MKVQKPDMKLRKALAEAIVRALWKSPDAQVWEAEAGDYEPGGDTWVFVNVIDPESQSGSYQLRLDLEIVGWLDEEGRFMDEKPAPQPEPPPNFLPGEYEDDPYPEFPNGEFGNEETRYSLTPSDPLELADIDAFIEELEWRNERDARADMKKDIRDDESHPF